ncbi:MAG TPA: NAD-dependent epimerase/dehydratase family protein [Candidatus Limnocylindrales bacterium]|nr:NAD-dependent epimerase/dehydratase family protein [Candidatus Limnocylindrales bacterium]
MTDPAAQTVLVTGGAGFVGASVIRLLAARGDRVRVLDDFSTGQRAYLEGVEHDLTEGTLADPDIVRRGVEGADAVVHLAARADIDDSIDDPLGSFNANVVETVGLLDEARRAGVERFVLASTNAVAGDAPPPAVESLVPHPVSPYGASKVACEAYCQAYAGAYGMAATALRFANVYGPSALHKRSVVAMWLRAALEEERLVLNGDGSQTRDYIYVEDLADAVARVLDAEASAVAGEVFQIGTGEETSLNDLADALATALDRDLDVEPGPARAGDVARNVSDVEKAAEQLGFRATTPLVDGLARTAAWYESALEDPRLAGIQPHPTSGSD